MTWLSASNGQEERYWTCYLPVEADRREDIIPAICQQRIERENMDELSAYESRYES